MKVLTAALLLLAARALAAPSGGELGAGPLIGDPIAASAKYFIDPRQAVDLGLGVSADELNVIGDYAYHFWGLLPQPKTGALALYAGAGARLEMAADNDFLARAPVGLSYWPKLKRRRIEFFLELGPAFRIAPDVHWRLDGGFGLRDYFLPSGGS